MRTQPVLAALVLVAILASPVIASFGLPDEPAPRFVAVSDGTPQVVDIPHADVHGRREDVLHPLLPTATRPPVRIPRPRLIVVKVAPRLLEPERPTSGSGAGASGVAGRASWYDDGPGLYAAAGPALRIGSWRGRTVVVRAGTHEVRLRLTDWCQCYFRTDHERAIDLSPEAFRRLAPLGRGIVTVTISW